jgi:hypothetical protein
LTAVWKSIKLLIMNEIQSKSFIIETNTVVMAIRLSIDMNILVFLVSDNAALSLSRGLYYKMDDLFGAQVCNFINRELEESIEE